MGNSAQSLMFSLIAILACIAGVLLLLSPKTFGWETC